MYILGAHIVTTYSGIPYHQFVKERIWDNLDLSQSTFSASEASKHGKLTQSWYLGRRLILYWSDGDIVDLSSGPGGVMSSAEDLVSTGWVKISIWRMLTARDARRSG